MKFFYIVLIALIVSINSLHATTNSFHDGFFEKLGESKSEDSVPKEYRLNELLLKTYIFIGAHNLVLRSVAKNISVEIATQKNQLVGSAKGATEDVIFEHSLNKAYKTLSNIIGSTYPLMVDGQSWDMINSFMSNTYFPNDMKKIISEKVQKKFAKSTLNNDNDNPSYRDLGTWIVNETLAFTLPYMLNNLHELFNNNNTEKNKIFDQKLSVLKVKQILATLQTNQKESKATDSIDFYTNLLKYSK